MSGRENLMMKCDLCYDRTSVDLKPMCASACPSQALFFGTFEEIQKLRPSSAPIHRFRFGKQPITTKVQMMVPRREQEEVLDVTAAMHEPSQGLDLLDCLNEELLLEEN